MWWLEPLTVFLSGVVALSLRHDVVQTHSCAFHRRLSKAMNSQWSTVTEPPQVGLPGRPEKVSSAHRGHAHHH